MKADRDLIEARAQEAQAVGTPDWAGLMPVGVAALGPPTRPVARLIGAQRAVYRLIVWLGSPRGRPSAPVADTTVPQTDTPAGA